MPIRDAVKPVLFAFAVCIAVGSGVGFERLLGSTGPSVDLELTEEQRNGNSGPGNANAGVSGQNTTPSILTSSCVMRQFACARGALSSCYKRWRSTGISCTDTTCANGNCIKSEEYFARYKLESWDTGVLPGPFPRTETMCIIQSSACAPDNPECLGPVSLEQISCDDDRCMAGTCTRLSVLVDQTDTIVSGLPTNTPPPKGETPNEGQGGQQTNNQKEGGNEETGASQNQGEGNVQKMNEATVVEERKPLGCFTTDGVWTADRTQCAVNQKQYVEPSTPVVTNEPENTEEQKVVERKIESQFVPDTRKSALVQNILSSTIQATDRMSRILETPDLPQDVRSDLEQKLLTLRDAQKTASDSEKSVQDLQKLAGEVSLNLGSAQETVGAWMETRSQRFPVTVTDKLDKFFVVLPTVFNILLQANVFVDSATMDGYIRAQQLYDSIRQECMNDAKSCGNLSNVIDALEPVFANIRLSLEQSGRTDLEEQIDALLQ